MSFRKIKFIFAKRTEMEEHYESLQKSLDQITSLYYVDKFDNGLDYLVESTRIGLVKIAECLNVDNFTVLNADVIEGQPVTVFIIEVKTAVNKTFNELDQERIEAMWK